MISFLEYAADQIAIALAQRQAQEALAASEERYRGLFENMTEGYAYCRMLFENGRPQDWIYLVVNEAFETLTGLKNAAGKRVSEVIPGIRESDPELFAIYARVATTGKPEKFEMFVESLKTWFSISVYSPEKEYFVAVFDVITERKRAEEALQASEERFRQMFEHMSSGMVVYEAVEDGEDFIIKEFNPAAERAAKVKRAEVVGRRVLEFFPDLKDIGLFERSQRVWRTGVPEHHPASLYRDERLAIWVENYVFKLPSGEIVAIFDDITDRKLAETELRKSEVWHRSLIELGVSVVSSSWTPSGGSFTPARWWRKFSAGSPTEFLRQVDFRVRGLRRRRTGRAFLRRTSCKRRGGKSGCIAHIRCKDGELSSRWRSSASICSTNRPCKASS